MHICMVWTSHDKTLRFYWFLKFGQLPTHPSVFSPRKSRHAPKFTHPSPGTNVNVTRGNFKLWLCAGSDVVGSLLILSIFLLSTTLLYDFLVGIDYLSGTYPLTYEGYEILRMSPVSISWVTVCDVVSIWLCPFFDLGDLINDERIAYCI